MTPGSTSSPSAPSDAKTLFDGKDLSKWEGSRGGDAKWKVENGYMEAVKGTGAIRTKEKFPDFQQHLEFATPAQVQGNSQGRGNSGVLINGMYEVQVLDSYNNPTYPDGQAGAIYGQTPPLVNASRPPGEWQSYDIIFESPRWDDKNQVVKKGNVTVFHNGVVLHHRREFLGATDGVGGVAHKGWLLTLSLIRPKCSLNCRITTIPSASAISGFVLWASMTRLSGFIRESRGDGAEHLSVR